MQDRGAIAWVERLGDKSMAAAEATMTLSLTVQAVLRTESNELAEVEVTDIDRVLG